VRFGKVRCGFYFEVPVGLGMVSQGEMGFGVARFGAVR
jgi:hypothetical protein